MSSLAAPAPAATVRVGAGTTAGEALREASLSGTGSSTVVVVRAPDGALKDLAWRPDEDVDVEPVAADTDDGRAVIRHSAAHVLAQAVQQKFPDAKLGIGPPVADGFYYDFAVDKPFTPDDLADLEKSMKKIIKAKQRFVRREYESLDAAREELASEPFKLELVDLKGTTDEDDSEIMEVGSGDLTAYDNIHAHTGERVWGDLCRGPHIPTTGYIPAFKITRSAAAYWRGDQRNAQLQRIYGTAWESPEAQDAYLERLAEAERRDHRRLGAELDLFSFPDEIGSGLAVFHPKGGIIRKELEDYSRKRHTEAGYEFVNTPHATKGELFQTSGHLDWYREGMFPAMHLDAEYGDDGELKRPGIDYYLKPMNCPMHNLIFRARGRSYRELPLRLFEFGTVYRYEKSGVVHGLTRARGFTQDDAHIYCTREQMAGEITSLLTFVLGLLRDYGLDDFYLELSTRNPEKSIGTDEEWEEATQALRDAASSFGLDLVDDPGGAAFYAPKISVQAKDAIGRYWQMSTIQVDLMLPDRFELEYTASDGSRQRPVMIHRALFGSIERFFGVLTEHYAGAFPAWLAPVQAVAIPVSGEQTDYVDGIVGKMKALGLRAEADHSDDRMQKKIRTHTLAKVPFLLLAGGKDADANAVSFRFRDGSQVNGVPVDDAVAAVADWVARRENTSPDEGSFGPHVTRA
ncbi:threonine--tRNA ligase [Actinomycetospora endophytica]|uniref:Threonine--tRNA ligase n=1 Tax=Actinomycetospora endophytica TaxID=2291215 RepID=A0ABS8PEA4_9PSEU|nr:threonine--tRNA ligase [Actinomycetospora endophytica]MCD2196604.1 threonine--tRNA ligase [Actinomycetospora endophytica]